MSTAHVEGRTEAITVDAGGRRLAATVMGSGEPLVLLETGFGVESGSWAAVANGVAAFTRVCFYDRAGRGASEPASRPRRPDDLVQDARRVVHALAPGKPAVLVGQSFGGLIARLFAQNYPAEVAALVLVDSMHEDQFDACAPHFPPMTEGEPGMLSSMRSFWSGGWRDPSNNQEGIDMVSCQAEAGAIKSLGRMPVRVLTASTFTFPPRFPPQVGGKLQAIWQELQSRFTRLSTDASQRILEDSGHFVQTDRPQAVVDAIADVVAIVRRERRPGQAGS